MNRTYKVIWSKARHCYVVVSELTKSQHKSSSKSELISTNVHRGGVLGKAAVAAIVAGLLTFGSYGLADAAGPAATENGPASKADGIASIAVGVGDQVVANKGKMYQGATAIAAGTLNVIDAAAEVNFDGVANSVIGQVNYTKNANAAVIMGAGNKVTNSYKDVKLDEKTLQALRQAYQQNNMQKVTEILQKAVPNSGGQVMVMGGGNTVDYAQSSQVMGVSNILKGKDSISKYNLVDGFQNNVTDAQNTYVVGTKNIASNTQNTIVLGDNRRLDKVKGVVVIGSADTTLTTNVDNGVVIGNNAQVLHSGGTTGKTMGNGDIAIGANAHTNNYIDQGGGIAIGSNSFVENMTGGLERSFDFNQAGYFSIGKRKYGYPYDPSKMITGVAIGQNTYARSGSVMLGTHNYKGSLGDVTVDSANSKQQNGSILSTTIGTNSYANGMFSTVMGAYTIASSNYSSVPEDAGKNFGATVVGSLNSIESATASSGYSGVANSIVGTANRTFNSNGSLIFGAGNEITNSVTEISTPSDDGGDSAQALQQTLMQTVKDSKSGGATLAIGGGNTADYTLHSQLIGVGNTLKGSNASVSEYNMIDGYENTATNVSNTKIIGSNNMVNNKANSNTIIGDKHVVAAEKTNNVIIGNADDELTTSAFNAVLIGHNADVKVDRGVALGSGSVASIGAEVHGWDPTTKAASTTDSNVWKSSWAAVSVGDAANKFTRQITNVAAGFNDTDAVNVAQLKAAMNNAGGSKINLVAGDGIRIDTNNGTYTISANITGGKTTTDTTTVTPNDSNSGTSGDSGSTDKENTDTSGNGKELVVTTETKPTKFADDEGTVAEVKPSETLTINGDQKNIATKVDGKAISVKLKDDINVKTVTATSMTATDSIGIKDGPSMTKNGIDAASKKITNVAAGTETTDAVNYGQLKDVESKVDSNTQNIYHMDNRISNLDNRVNKVGAGAAALAALHPLDFDPDDKWDFAVGYGNYRNANSVALGAFYRPNEDTMFSLGTNFGNGENMFNAGLSFKIGQGGSGITTSKTAMAKKIESLENTVDQQDKKIAELEALVKEQGEMIRQYVGKK